MKHFALGVIATLLPALSPPASASPIESLKSMSKREGTPSETGTNGMSFPPFYSCSCGYVLTGYLRRLLLLVLHRRWRRCRVHKRSRRRVQRRLDKQRRFRCRKGMEPRKCPVSHVHFSIICSMITDSSRSGTLPSAPTTSPKAIATSQSTAGPPTPWSSTTSARTSARTIPTLALHIKAP